MTKSGFLIILLLALGSPALSAEVGGSIGLGSRRELMLDDFLFEIIRDLEFRQHSPREAEKILELDAAWADANDRIRVALIGAGLRGRDLMYEASELDGVEVAVICDPDERRMAEKAAELEKKTGKRPIDKGCVGRIACLSIRKPHKTPYIARATLTKWTRKGLRGIGRSGIMPSGKSLIIT